ncbi:MAG: hypothetical protein HY765_00675 [Rhodomicrobium sp.]|nr:hypothetical protein [Rhodomicrobium sp.]
MRRSLIPALLAFFLLPCAGHAGDSPDPALSPSDSEKHFLDRLMALESGGRVYARNPASSAFGPYQFIRDTFLDVIQRRFPALAAGKSHTEILELRANPDVARNAALVYTRENASFFAARGTPVTAAHLRLAFFVGPSGALKVLAAAPEEPVANILSAAALQANPFLKGMTAGELIGKSSRDAQGIGPLSAAAMAKAPAGAPKITVRCNLKLPSCRKWLALAEKRLALATARPKTLTAAR